MRKPTFQILPKPNDKAIKSIYFKYINEDISEENCIDFIRDISNSNGDRTTVLIAKKIIGKYITKAEIKHINDREGIWCVERQTENTKIWSTIEVLDILFNAAMRQ